MSINFILLLVALLSLPGFALTTALKLKQNRFLITFAFSYALFTLALIISKSLSISHTHFSYAVGVYLICSIVVLFIKKEGLNKPNQPCNLAAIVVGITVMIYHILVSPYNEIPADIYAHIERYQSAYTLQQLNHLGPQLTAPELLMQKAGIWYHLLAFTAHITNTSIDDVVYSTTLVSKLLFLIGLYYFGLSVFKNNKHTIAASLITCLFVALHMGINVFAYIRYYSFAPSMLNFVLYFSAVAVFLNGIQQPWHKHNLARLLFILALCLTAACIHTQEAMFIVVMCFLITLCANVSSYHNLRSNQSNNQSPNSLTFISLSFMTLIGVSGFIFAYIMAHEHMNRAPNISWRLWEFGAGSGLWPDISILNLKYQFIRVLTLWGCFVYLLFLCHWQRYKNNLFIIAGMLSPLLTILNPFFVDLFLRLNSSTTLWRLCYLIPIHFIAADLFVYYTNKLRASKKWQQTSIAAGVISLLIILLLPIQNTWQQMHYSRFPTLDKVAPTQSHEHLTDVIDYLNTISKKHLILTDPVTGYVVSGMTHHHSNRRKFHRTRHNNFTFDDYNNDPLQQYRGHLLIINLRTQGHSQVGQLAKHWPADVLNTLETYYPKQLLSHIDASPNRFEKQWANNNIAIYLIH